MGSKSQKSQNTSNYNAALSAANTPSPVESELNTESLDTLNWLKAGDYRKRPKNIFFNFADPAERRRHRELVSNAGGQGTVALGAGNPTALALDKANRDDENSRDDSAAYEQDVAQAGEKAAAIGGNLAQMNLSRRLGVLGTTANVYNNSQSQLSWFDKLLLGAQRAAQTGAMVGA